MIVVITIPFAEFSSMAPSGGISGRIAYYSFGTYGGFLSGWSLFLWSVMIPPIEAVAVSQYASYYVPPLYDGSTHFLTGYGILLSVLITIFFVLLNLAGIRLVGKFNTAITWIKILSLAALVVMVPVLLFNTSNFTTPSFIPSNGWSGVFIAIPATGILFSFGGYRQVADMAGEIKNPRRNLPLAIGITLAVQSIFYILMSVVIVGAVNWSALGFQPGDWQSVAGLSAPLADLMRAGGGVATGFSGPLLSGLVILALLFAVFSPLGTLGVYLTGASRVVFGFSKEGALPDSLGKTDRRGVPVYALILVAIAGDLFLIPLPSWYSLVNFVVVAATVNFAIVAASLPVIRKFYPNLPRPFRVPFHRAWSLAAFILSSLLIYWATFPTTLYSLGAALAGSVVYLYQGLNTGWKNAALRSSAWIPFFIIGLMILSYLGPRVTGGVNAITFPFDVLAVSAYGASFWTISQLTASARPPGDMNRIIPSSTDE